MTGAEPEGGSWTRRAILLLPAAAIVALAAYLAVEGRARERPAVRALTPAPTLPPAPSPTPAPQISPVVVTATPPSSSAGVAPAPPFASGFLTGAAVEPSVPPQPNWRLPRDERILNRVLWGPGPPRIALLSLRGDAYDFLVDGFEEGEQLLIDRSSLRSSVGGYPTTLPAAEVTAAPAEGTGAVVTVRFNDSPATAFGPTFQLLVRGSHGSVAFATAPYLHRGPLSTVSTLVRDFMENRLLDNLFTIYLPSFPQGTILVSAWPLRHGRGIVLNWVMSTAGGHTSLVLMEHNACDYADVDRVIQCFGPVMAGIEEVEELHLGRHQWQIGRAGAEWAIAARLDGTYVLMTAVDRAALIRAAESIGGWGSAPAQ